MRLVILVTLTASKKLTSTKNVINNSKDKPKKHS